MEDFKEVLKEICQKDATELTESDKETLRARVSYLSKEEVEKFAEVLEGLESVPEEEPEGETEIGGVDTGSVGTLPDEDLPEGEGE